MIMINSNTCLSQLYYFTHFKTFCCLFNVTLIMCPKLLMPLIIYNKLGGDARNPFFLGGGGGGVVNNKAKDQPAQI